MRELRLRELKFFSQGHTQSIRGRIHSLLALSLLFPRSILKVSFCILKQSEKGDRALGSGKGSRTQPTSAGVGSCIVCMARHESTEKGRKQGSTGFPFCTRQLSQPITCGQVLTCSEPLFLLSFLGGQRGAFFSVLKKSSLSQSRKCNKSLTWMLGKIRVYQRVGRQAGREITTWFFSLISVSSPVMTDLTPVQYVLEIYLTGICDYF